MFVVTKFEIFQYLIKTTEPRRFREKKNHRDSDKNKWGTFEPRGGDNFKNIIIEAQIINIFKNIELEWEKSGPYKKSVHDTI